MELHSVISECKHTADLNKLANIIPYTRLLGVQLSLDSKNPDKLLAHLPFQQKNIGNPLIPALHGGVIGGFMEHAAIMQLMWNLEPVRVPKTIDFSIDYLRSGKAEDCYADVLITRQGRRIAQCQVTAWQTDPSKPIATARAHFLITEK